MTTIYRLQSLAIQGYRPFRDFRAKLGALEVLLRDNFWPNDATGAWTVPTPAQRELLRRRRARPQPLSPGLKMEGE